MILSIDVCGYIKLKEVANEEEAFYEMSRYMSVNNIHSDTTTVSKVEITDRFGTSEEVKLVEMCDDEDGAPVFVIHYNTHPVYDSLQDAVSAGTYFAYCYNEYKTKKSHKYNSLKFLRYKTAEQNSCFESWFPDEYKRYMDDLNKRVGGVCR